MSVGHTAITTVEQPAARQNRCEIRHVLDRIGDTWTVLVVGELARRPHRFRELQRGVDGISQRMLTLTLRRLERDGLVSRTVVPAVPVQVTYALTDLGVSLLEALRRLSAWASAHRAEIELHRHTWDEANPDTKIR